MKENKGGSRSWGGLSILLGLVCFSAYFIFASNALLPGNDMRKKYERRSKMAATGLKVVGPRGGVPVELVDALQTREASWFQPKEAPGESDMRLRKYLLVGGRKDLVAVVQPALREVGLVPTTGDDWDLLWACDWDNAATPAVLADDRAWRMVNQYPHMRQLLGSKDALGEWHQKCLKRWGADACSYTPVSFKLPGQRLQWEAALQEDTRQPWILKPVNGFNGEGIAIVTGRDEVEITDDAWVAQRYLDQPLLVDGHKFDVRVWALVTSLNPLRIYLLKQGFAKVAAHPYNDDLEDLCSHNTSPPKNCNFTKLNGFPRHTSAKRFHEHVTYADQADGQFSPDQQFRRWNHVVWPGIEEAVFKAVAMAWSKNVQMYQADEAGKQGFKRFQWLHFDVLVDALGKAWVEEVNTNGFFTGNTHGYHTTDCMRSGMELAGVRGYDRSGYRDWLALVPQFCATLPQGCTAQQQSNLVDFIDEYKVTEKTGKRWYLVYPEPSTSEEYSKFLGGNQGPENQMLRNFQTFLLAYLEGVGHGAEGQPPRGPISPGAPVPGLRGRI